MDYFTTSDIEGEYIAHKLKHLLGWPSNQQLVNDLSKNLIISCPVLSDDVRRAYAIYGPATTILKGKMMRKQPTHIEFKQHIPIQVEILKHYQELPLNMDFCFINRHPCFTTINGKVDDRTISLCRG